MADTARPAKKSKGKQKAEEASAHDLSSFLLKSTEVALDSDLNSLFSSSKPLVSIKRSNETDADSPEARARRAAEKIKRQAASVAARSSRTPKLTPTASALAPTQSSNAKRRRSTPSEAEESAEEQSDSDSAPPIHVSLLPGGEERQSKPRKAKKAKLTDEDISERNARTVFIGNVVLAAASSKSTSKALVRHLFSTLPEQVQAVARCESIRYRSLPLAAPVTQPKSSQSHAKARAEQWKQHANGASQEPAQEYLTPAQQRKVAFIKHELHPSGQNCNAYAVLQLTSPAADLETSADLATLLATSANATVFEERTLRVDLVKSASDAASSPGKTDSHSADHLRRTCYVGNLDFAQDEEGIRKVFEDLLRAERGAPPAGKPYVESVRVVRDRDTGLGKGFAYVLLHDEDCVDEMFAIEASKVKVSKRKVRLERCKTSAALKSIKVKKEAAAGSLQGSKAAVDKRDPKRDRTHKTHPLPKVRVNQDIGEKIKDLSKEERKEYKANDESRLARRLEKKRAKAALLKADSRSKQKEKLRTKRDSGKPKMSSKKSRVRSDAQESRKTQKKV
ncbi:uncharacterized protein L969DRAFT_82989 [Mixia osmundae IAM 14324]|uniref:Nucleolar protein 12 n=1 Tax=Mixia osmundae (strain CBS 9802 / IAM 14324 / JCM 22182 / KY 12970) TaxID=764103 RepID=G7EA53_MIXOS|nr:uncharacterized protein L969DRAFT_82989 [Mixia osmundae IAM 14324]KEI37611.1 hypothetical protein L969DRAFT_82989 [Mixia osmundae IAM 14324]GAA99713.1 hypothetical protein E5Q_06416 [Mixia osmundae IAM 14324]